ncbi:MAG: response regulator [Bryobacteraceae bacterium]
MKQRPIEILLVEDSPSDVWLIRQALQEGAIPKRIGVVGNGEQAVDYLRKRGPYLNSPRPDVILLDLNLPRLTGLEVLREIKSDPDLRSITVIVLTTSEAAKDVNAAYDLNANCYVVKPVDFDQFTAAIRGIEEFWMRVASLPSLTDPPAPKEGRKDEAAANGGGAAQNNPSSHGRAQFRTLQRGGAGRRSARWARRLSR